MEELYGKADMFCSVHAYRALAARHGLVLVSDQAVTRHTLPSYPYLYALLQQLQRDDTAAVADSLKRLETLARASALAYRFLAFRRR
jgi:hypothetical protein